MPDETEAFYMAVDNPKDFRREVLNSNKALIQLLQQNEKLKSIREKKITLMYQFHDILGEVRMLSGKLKEAIPKTRLRNNPTETIQKKYLQTSGKSALARKNSVDDLAKLHDELSDIEGKLSELQ